MAVFSCPECGALSQSNRDASYYWCACGRPLTAADAVPGMAGAGSDETSQVLTAERAEIVSDEGAPAGA